MIVPFILESKADAPHAKKIAEVLDNYGVPYKIHVASACTAPEVTLEIIEKYNEMKESVVFVSIAGQSTALSGVIAGNTHRPVIACPPLEDGTFVRMPSETPVLSVIDPKNAGQAAVRLLAMSNKDLAKKIKNHIKVVKHGFSPNPISID